MIQKLNMIERILLLHGIWDLHDHGCRGRKMYTSVTARPEEGQDVDEHINQVQVQIQGCFSVVVDGILYQSSATEYLLGVVDYENGEDYYPENREQLLHNSPRAKATPTE